MSNLWRYIDESECEPYYNMALDEAISICVREVISLPTLRVYGWRIPSVTIGYFQKINDINYEYCRNNNIPIIRRPTGGRAIFHDKDITYSISVNKESEIYSFNLFESYEKIAYAFYHAFLKSGVDAEIEYRMKKDIVIKSSHCFQTASYAEIIYKGNKLIGSAQKRWLNGFLQQGCIPFSVDRDRLKGIFKLDYGLVQRILTISDLFPDVSIERLKENIFYSFKEILGIEFFIEKPKKEELIIADGLLKNKYMTDAWIYKR